MPTYKTIAGDVLDELMWRYYGTQSSAMLRAVYQANRHLADLPATLPSGVEIVFPEIATVSDVQSGVTLWT